MVMAMTEVKVHAKRFAYETGDRVVVEMSIEGYYSIDTVADELAGKYNIPKEKVKEVIKKLWEEHTSVLGKTTKYYEESFRTEINKYHENLNRYLTRNELKREVKAVTMTFERFLKDLTSEIQRLSTEHALKGWLYDEMIYDPEKGKFIPSE